MKKILNFVDNPTVITYLVFLLILLLDQISKHLIINNLPITVDIAARTYSNSATYEVFTWLWLKHVVNFGAAFSLFYGKTYPLILFVSLIVIVLLTFERNTFKNRTKMFSISLGFILAGALGNLTDRIRLGYVTDFFALIYQEKFIWPIFNIADISVDIGVGLYLLYILLQEIKNKKEAQVET